MHVDACALAKWEALHADADALERLPAAVKSAWKRSLARRLPPDCTPPQLSRAEMARVKHTARQLYVYTNSILRPMFIRSPYPLLGGLLFSREGELLQLYGPQTFQDWAAEMKIRPGTMWAEEAIGPNIFSLGIGREKGMKLDGAESYARFLLGGMYYFAPIMLPNGEVLGGLGLAVPGAHGSDEIQTFALMATRMIELQFFWFNIVETYGDSSDGQGILTLDQSKGTNRILTLSKEIIKMLEMEPGNYYYEHLERIIDPLPANPKFWDVVNKTQRVMDKRMELQAGGRSYVVSLSTSHFQEDNFHTKGMVLNINSIQRINRLVSKYSGNAARYDFTDVIGVSAPWQETVKRCKIAAISGSNILLLGESGVGKDVLAQAIHNTSRRRSGPFVAINCAAFSKELISSELFGYESGAFTGAKKGGSVGKFEMADNGTLFLDEIGDMPLDLQALLLRVLEQRSFMKVGGNTLIDVNVRIIAATNIDLRERIRKGLFREDLFYRLGVVRVQIPPLRERGDDVFKLAEHFIPQICSRLDKPRVTLSDDTVALFRQYRWPGNVRELQNLLEGIIGTHNDLVITADAVRQYLGNLEQEPTEKASAFLRNEVIYDEREELLQALRICRNNRTKAAAYLGISRRTMYRRLAEHGLT